MPTTPVSLEMKNVRGLKMLKNTKRLSRTSMRKGMFSSWQVPGALVINSSIMAEESEKGKQPDDE